MPMMKLTTNCTISSTQAEAIKDALGQSAAKLGKSERFLMVEIAGDAHLYFGGSDAPAAILAVDTFGESTSEQADDFTTAATNMIAHSLAIPADRIFVRYMATNRWGWNGANF